jgi:hypothetical protein
MLDERSVAGRVTVLTVTAAVVLSLTVAGASGTALTDASPSPAAVPPTVDLLYVLDATSGTLTRRPGKDLYVLTLKGTPNHVTAFSDRPDRLSFIQRRSSYFSAWQKSYANDPPNAALQLLRTTQQGRDRADTVILTLQRPRIDGDTITFLARRLPTAAGGLSDHARRLLNTVPARFGSSSLFIDDTTWSPFVVFLNGAGSSDGSTPGCADGSESSSSGSCPALTGSTFVSQQPANGAQPWDTAGDVSAGVFDPVFSWTNGGANITLSVDLCGNTWQLTDPGGWAYAPVILKSGTVTLGYAVNSARAIVSETTTVVGGTDTSLAAGTPGGPLYADLEYTGSGAYTLLLSGYLHYSVDTNYNDVIARCPLGADPNG